MTCIKNEYIVSRPDFLTKIIEKVRNFGFELINTDITIQIQKPKINPHIPAMQNRIAEIMDILPDQISVKAKTGEKIGFIGREEGVSVQAIALLEKK